MIKRKRTYNKKLNAIDFIVPDGFCSNYLSSNKIANIVDIFDAHSDMNKSYIYAVKNYIPQYYRNSSVSGEENTIYKNENQHILPNCNGTACYGYKLGGNDIQSESIVLTEGTFSERKSIYFPTNSTHRWVLISGVNIASVPMDSFYVFFGNCTSSSVPERYFGYNTSGNSNSYENSKLEIVQIRSNITEIPDNMFMNCNMIRGEVIIPDTVTKIGISAFESTPISNIVFSESGNLKTINTKAFYACVNLNKIILPNGLQTIYSGAFSEIGNLIEFSIPSSINSTSAYNKFGLATKNNNTKIKRLILNGVIEYNDTLIQNSYSPFYRSLYNVTDIIVNGYSDGVINKYIVETKTDNDGNGCKSLIWQYNAGTEEDPIIKRNLVRRIKLGTGGTFCFDFSGINKIVGDSCALLVNTAIGDTLRFGDVLEKIDLNNTFYNSSCAITYDVLKNTPLTLSTINSLPTGVRGDENGVCYINPNIQILNSYPVVNVNQYIINNSTQTNVSETLKTIDGILYGKVNALGDSFKSIPKNIKGNDGIVTIPNTILNINGFSGCDDIREIIIENSGNNQTINSGAFDNMKSLVSVRFSCVGLSFGNVLFYNGCFLNMGSIGTEIVLPNNILLSYNDVPLVYNSRFKTIKIINSDNEEITNSEISGKFYSKNGICYYNNNGYKMIHSIPPCYRSGCIDVLEGTKILFTNSQYTFKNTANYLNLILVIPKSCTNVSQFGNGSNMGLFPHIIIKCMLSPTVSNNTVLLQNVTSTYKRYFHYPIHGKNYNSVGNWASKSNTNISYISNSFYDVIFIQWTKTNAVGKNIKLIPVTTTLTGIDGTDVTFVGTNVWVNPIQTINILGTEELMNGSETLCEQYAFNVGYNVYETVDGEDVFLGTISPKTIAPDDDNVADDYNVINIDSLIS